MESLQMQELKKNAETDNFATAELSETHAIKELDAGSQNLCS